MSYRVMSWQGNAYVGVFPFCRACQREIVVGEKLKYVLTGVVAMIDTETGQAMVSIDTVNFTVEHELLDDCTKAR